jgi:hypothetical protein
MILDLLPLQSEKCPRPAHDRPKARPRPAQGQTTTGSRPAHDPAHDRPNRPAETVEDQLAMILELMPDSNNKSKIITVIVKVECAGFSRR